MATKESIKVFIDDALKNFGVNIPGEQQGDKYVVTLSGSDEYSRMYTKLDKCDFADLDVDHMIMSDSMCSITYLTDNLDITLLANFDKDEYKLIFEGAKDA